MKTPRPWDGYSKNILALRPLPIAEHTADCCNEMSPDWVNIYPPYNGIPVAAGFGFIVLDRMWLHQKKQLG